MFFVTQFFWEMSRKFDFSTIFTELSKFSRYFWLKFQFRSKFFLLSDSTNGDHHHNTIFIKLLHSSRNAFRHRILADFSWNSKSCRAGKTEIWKVLNHFRAFFPQLGSWGDQPHNNFYRRLVCCKRVLQFSHRYWLVV